MVFLIALAMGTMLCASVFELIPEAFDVQHAHTVEVLCESCGDVQYIQIIEENCVEECKTDDTFSLTIGGTREIVAIIIISSRRWVQLEHIVGGKLVQVGFPLGDKIDTCSLV